MPRNPGVPGVCNRAVFKFWRGHAHDHPSLTTPPPTQVCGQPGIPIPYTGGRTVGWADKYGHHSGPMFDNTGGGSTSLTADDFSDETNPVLVPEILGFRGTAWADNKPSSGGALQTAPRSMTSFGSGQCVVLPSRLLALCERSRASTNRLNPAAPCRCWLLKQLPFHDRFSVRLAQPELCFVPLVGPDAATIGSALSVSFLRSCLSHGKHLHRVQPEAQLGLPRRSHPPAPPAFGSGLSPQQRRDLNQPGADQRSLGRDTERGAEGTTDWNFLCGVRMARAHCEALRRWRQIAPDATKASLLRCDRLFGAGSGRQRPWQWSLFPVVAPVIYF